jgi:hypothetical protein
MSDIGQNVVSNDHPLKINYVQPGTLTVKNIGYFPVVVGPDESVDLSTGYVVYPFEEKTFHLEPGDNQVAITRLPNDIGFQAFSFTRNWKAIVCWVFELD